MDWLNRRGDVHQITVDGELVRFAHDGDRSAEAALLKQMVLADFTIAEFASQPKSLEEVFMHVTRGRVQ